MKQKLITFGIPCYNSSAYMDHCIESILEGADYSEDIQICIVDDGSTKDDTGQKADAWAEKYPHIIKSIHQDNGGHGQAVLTGLRNADGVYYKVIDSDDWVDKKALTELLELVRGFVRDDKRVDLVVTNYVYEHQATQSQKVVDYTNCMPQNEIMGWDRLGRFGISQYFMMHSLLYRTDILRANGGLDMPAHTFYVDTIYAYVPLPRVKTLYYLNVDLYRYFIGRDDQSVNEDVLISRIDHYWRVSRIMMKAYHLDEDIECKKLRNYMMNYFTIIMTITSLFSRMSPREDAISELTSIWNELKEYDKWMYRHARTGFLGVASNLPGRVGNKITLGIYKTAQKVLKFN